MRGRPSSEHVDGREHELRIVQRKRRCVGSAVVQVDLAHRVGVARAKRRQQLLCLAFELVQIGMLAQRAGWCGVA